MKIKFDNKRRIFSFCVCLLLIFSVTLLSYIISGNETADNVSTEVLVLLKDQIICSRLQNDSIINISKNSKESFETSDCEEMKTIQIGENNYIGYISIPSIGVELTVMDEWDNNKLKISPCKCYGSICTDDIVISGHNHAKDYEKLSSLNKGDYVIFTDADGSEIFYRVAVIEMLDVADVSEMIDGGYDLSIYTCSCTGTTRVTVRGMRITI